jgi:hypothetical protein
MENYKTSAHPFITKQGLDAHPGMTKLEHISTEIASAVLISGPVKKIGELAKYSASLASLILDECERIQSGKPEVKSE